MWSDDESCYCSASLWIRMSLCRLSSGLCQVWVLTRFQVCHLLREMWRGWEAKVQPSRRPFPVMAQQAGNFAEDFGHTSNHLLNHLKRDKCQLSPCNLWMKYLDAWERASVCRWEKGMGADRSQRDQWLLQHFTVFISFGITGCVTGRFRLIKDHLASLVIFQVCFYAHHMWKSRKSSFYMLGLAIKTKHRIMSA